MAFLPILLTAGLFPWAEEGEAGWWLFLPQGVSYLSLVLWLCVNHDGLTKLGIHRRNLALSCLLGVATGLLTGAINLLVILKLTPFLGESYAFLRNTPHARSPFLLMMPFGISLIAVLVELNFRGFLLGRLLTLWKRRSGGVALAIVLSALTFSFDPFMVATFHTYHWLALSDGLIWGYLFYRTGNLLSTILAHAVEVMITYTTLTLLFS